jgi:hypothetical protein
MRQLKNTTNYVRSRQKSDSNLYNKKHAVFSVSPNKNSEVKSWTNKLFVTKCPIYEEVWRYIRILGSGAGTFRAAQIRIRPFPQVRFAAALLHQNLVFGSEPE